MRVRRCCDVEDPQCASNMISETETTWDYRRFNLKLIISNFLANCPNFSSGNVVIHQVNIPPLMIFSSFSLFNVIMHLGKREHFLYKGGKWQNLSDIFQTKSYMIRKLNKTAQGGRSGVFWHAVVEAGTRCNDIYRWSLVIIRLSLEVSHTWIKRILRFWIFSQHPKYTFV